MDQTGDFLDGTAWNVVRIGADEVEPEAPRTVEFALGRVSGQVGVNRFTGEYSIDGDSVVVGLAARTLMAGPPERMELEDRFHAAFTGRLPVAVGEMMLLGDIELAQTPSSRVRGTIWYRERMALPEGSRVVVELHDVSRADVPSDVVAVQTIAGVAGPPFEFDLELPEPFEEKRSYVLRAHIEGPDGRLMWTSDSRIDPRQQPLEVLLVRV